MPEPQGPPGSRGLPPLPRSIAVLRVVAVVRIAVASVSTVATIALLPGAVDRGVRASSARYGTTAPELHGVGVLAAVVAGGFSLAYLVGWALAARAALLRGKRWASVLLVVLSAYTVVSTGFVAVLLPIEHRLGLPAASTPAVWRIALSAAVLLCEVAVVVLTVLPASRAWFRAADPPPPRIPGPPVQPRPPRPPRRPVVEGGWDPFRTGTPAAGGAAPIEPDAPHLRQAPPGWDPRPTPPDGRRH